MIRTIDLISGFRWLKMKLLHMSCPTRARAPFSVALLETTWLYDVIPKIFKNKIKGIWLLLLRTPYRFASTQKKVKCELNVFSLVLCSNIASMTTTGIPPNKKRKVLTKRTHYTRVFDLPSVFWPFLELPSSFWYQKSVTNFHTTLWLLHLIVINYILNDGSNSPWYHIISNALILLRSTSSHYSLYIKVNSSPLQLFTTNNIDCRAIRSSSASSVIDATIWEKRTNFTNNCEWPQQTPWICNFLHHRI